MALPLFGNLTATLVNLPIDRRREHATAMVVWVGKGGLALWPIGLAAWLWRDGWAYFYGSASTMSQLDIFCGSASMMSRVILGPKRHGTSGQLA